MTRKLMLLDLALAVVVSFLVWQMRREWVEAHARAQGFLSTQVKQLPAKPLAALPKVSPLVAVFYAEVAQLDLFSKDRNPQVILDPVEPPKAKPIPAFPVARGVLLWDGAPPVVVLSLRPGGRQKGYHPGEQIGDWKIVSVDNQYVVFEWDGKRRRRPPPRLPTRRPPPRRKVCRIPKNRTILSTWALTTCAAASRATIPPPARWWKDSRK
jgi:hypothetical protein